jgi:hypothetical protein
LAQWTGSADWCSKIQVLQLNEIWEALQGGKEIIFANVKRQKSKIISAVFSSDES